MVRSYMLIGSTSPFLMFFRRGYIIQSGVQFKASDPDHHTDGQFDSNEFHLSFDKFQNHLATTKSTGTHYTDTFLQSAMKQVRVIRVPLHQAFLGEEKGSYQLWPWILRSMNRYFCILVFDFMLLLLHIIISKPVFIYQLLHIHSCIPTISSLY